MKWTAFLGIAFALSRAIYARWNVNRSAKKIAGLYGAHEWHDRRVDPMPMDGASITVVSARSLLRANAHILDVYGRDFKDGVLREHDGRIVIDRDCPNRATRTVIYRDSHEIAEQQIEIANDSRTLYITPNDRAYGRHVLCRSGLLGLS